MSAREEEKLLQDILFDAGYKAGLEAAAKICDEHHAKCYSCGSVGCLEDAKAIRKMMEGE